MYSCIEKWYNPVPYFHRVYIALCYRYTRRVIPLWSVKPCAVYFLITFHVLPSLSSLLDSQYIYIYIFSFTSKSVESPPVFENVEVTGRRIFGREQPFFFLEPTPQLSGFVCSLLCSPVVHRNVAHTMMENPQPRNCFFHVTGLIRVMCAVCTAG